MSDVRVTPQPWLWKPRVRPILLIEIHATRGSTTPAQQKLAALNWVRSPNNRHVTAWGEAWGGSFSYVIGADGDMGTVLDDNQMPTYSAGYGGPGSTYAIDEYGISYELAQSATQEPFTEACYRRAAMEIAAKCRGYGIPPVFIEIPLQSGPVPTGLVRHDRCQNGYVLGKTDPGNQFDEGKFIAMLQAELQEDAMGMTPEERAELDALKARLGALRTWQWGHARILRDADTSSHPVYWIEGKVHRYIPSRVWEAMGLDDADVVDVPQNYIVTRAPERGSDMTLEEVMGNPQNVSVERVKELIRTTRLTV